MSPLVLGEILGFFLTTMTADYKYLVQDCENLPLPIQMQVSEKQKLFLNFLLHFWNLHQTWNVLEEKMIVLADVFPKLQTVKNFLRTLSKKRRLRTRIDSQHVKASQMLGNLHESAFIMFFHHSHGRWFGKFLP